MNTIQSNPAATAADILANVQEQIRSRQFEDPYHAHRWAYASPDADGAILHRMIEEAIYRSAVADILGAGYYMSANRGEIDWLESRMLICEDRGAILSDFRDAASDKPHHVFVWKWINTDHDDYQLVGAMKLSHGSGHNIITRPIEQFPDLLKNTLAVAEEIGALLNAINCKSKDIDAGVPVFAKNRFKA